MGLESRRRRPQRRTPRRARSCRTPARRWLAADPRIAGVRASPADPRQEHAGRGCNPWRPSYTPASATTTWTGGPQPRARRPWPSVARGTAAWGPARRQSSRPQRDGARGAGASGAERAERAVDVAVRRPRLLEPRHHSLTRPRERGGGGTPARGPERERRPPMGERQHPQTGATRSGPSHPGSGESEAGSGEGEPGASPGGRRRTLSSKSRFGGRGRKRGKKKALESGHLHCAASLCRLTRSRGVPGSVAPLAGAATRAAAVALSDPPPAPAGERERERRGGRVRGKTARKKEKRRSLGIEPRPVARCRGRGAAGGGGGGVEALKPADP